MSKKKRKTNKGKKRPVPAKKVEKEKRRISPVGIAIGVFAIGVLLFFFGQQQLKNWNRSNSTKKKISTEEKIPFPEYTPAAKQEIAFNDFVGSEACASCHAKEYDLWKQSTHGKAGGAPSAKTVIGAFDGKGRSFHDGLVFPQKRGRDNYVFKLQADDMPEETYTVDAVVGGGHMLGGGTQTYFSFFPDGTLRFLPFDYIRGEQLWFGETDGGKGWIPITKGLSINELSEWPPSRVLGAHPVLENCQECHGSQIQVKYNAQKKRYDTKFTSLSINCESCHGPGKRHIAIAQSGAIDTAADIGMAALATLSKDESLEVCFRCHALKDVMEPGYLQGMDLEAHYALKYPIIGENPYHPDGRIRAFGYQQNHLFSDCYINGSMTCVDCHDPHSQDYRDITGKALADPFDDGQCTGCHGSKATDPMLHTHHPANSVGSKCVSCHMPYLQHQAMGQELQFARSDHTIPIPRPAFDAKLGIENACSKCHQDQSIEWLEAKTKEWYGEIKPHKDLVNNLIQAKEGLDRKSAGLLLLDRTTIHPIGQMMGLSQFVNDYLSPDMQQLEPEIIDKIKQFIGNPDLDVKSLAFASLHLAQDHNPEIHNYLAQQLGELKQDEADKVRKRWATALPFLAKKYEEQQQFDDAISTYKKALDILPNNAAILSNLGYTYQRSGNAQQAIHFYKKAIEANPEDAMGYVNLGNAEQNTGNTELAVQAYQKAVDVNPWNAIAHFNLGNHHYRLEELQQAIQYYEKAIEVDPSLAQAYFNLTRAYIKAQEYRKALTTVKSGLRFAPEDETGNQMRKDLEEAFRRVEGFGLSG